MTFEIKSRMAKLFIWEKHLWSTIYIYSLNFTPLFQMFFPKPLFEKVTCPIHNGNLYIFV